MEEEVDDAEEEGCGVKLTDEPSASLLKVPEEVRIKL
jgi:hypothetical protein